MHNSNNHDSATAVAAGLEQAYAFIASHPASSSPSGAHASHKSTARPKSVSYPTSPKAGGGSLSAGRTDAAATTATAASPAGARGPGHRKVSPSSANAGGSVSSSATLSPRGYASSNLARYPSNSYNSAPYIAPPPARTTSNSSHYGTLPSPSSGATANSSVEVKHGKLPGQIWMPEGIVDMTSFGPILAMDENDPSREFSKALVWAWCDQAEVAIEEMEQYVLSGEIARLADKAHYLKGSSASLGLLQVSATCHSIYHTHFPPSLAHLRTFSYTGGGNSVLSAASSRHSSSASSASSSFTPSAGLPSTPDISGGSSPSSSLYSPTLDSSKPMVSPRHAPGSANNGSEFPFHISSSTGYKRISPGSITVGNALGIAAGGDDTAAHFEKQKLARVSLLLVELKNNVKKASEWLYAYYRESDKFAGV